MVFKIRKIQFMFGFSLHNGHSIVNNRRFLGGDVCAKIFRFTIDCNLCFVPTLSVFTHSSKTSTAVTETNAVGAVGVVLRNAGCSGGIGGVGCVGCVGGVGCVGCVGCVGGGCGGIGGSVTTFTFRVKSCLFCTCCRAVVHVHSCAATTAAATAAAAAAATTGCI